MAKKQPEFDLQKAVCRYLDVQYPSALYLSDSVAQVKLTFPQQARNKAIQKQGFKCPDLLILEPNADYYGLFLELKATDIYKKDGSLKKNDHVEGQQKTLKDLWARGYFATFAIGFEQAKERIDTYFSMTSSAHLPGIITYH